jgi:hypothetical protein
MHLILVSCLVLRSAMHVIISMRILVLDSFTSYQQLEGWAEDLKVSLRAHQSRMVRIDGG